MELEYHREAMKASLTDHLVGQILNRRTRCICGWDEPGSWADHVLDDYADRMRKIHHLLGRPK